METITIRIDNEEKEYRKGIKLHEILENTKENYKHDIICAKFKNQHVNYNDSLVKNGTLTLFDINSKYGNKIYETGLIYLFVSCVKDILGSDVTVRVRYSIDKGIYCEINSKLNIEMLDSIKKLMKEKVKKEVPFIKIETSRMEAIDFFKKCKKFDKAKTLFYNTSPYITLYKFDGLYNYIIGELPNDTSVLKYFDLSLVNENGLVLRFPSIYDDGNIVRYTHHNKYFDSINEYSTWGNILNINNLGDLNEYIVHNKAGDLINLCEIMQDYKLLSIAEKIVLNKDNIKFVLISGPSSSGKTTTSKKLSLYLKSLGLNPIPISTDDYFLSREETPKDENGKYDFENIKALDIKLFNDHISKLLKGQKVIMPTFDFIKGQKIFNKPLQMETNSVLIIEGLHAINEDLTTEIPKKNKFKIYISPLAYLNVDNVNRINITDIRLLRRLVRDYRTRGYSASQTINNWADVRRGEEKYVFPYQDEADVVFNTFLAYELCVIKSYAEPLLYSIKEDDPEYLTAIRLLELLKFVLPVPSDDVPKISILREFIGNSYFE